MHTTRSTAIEVKDNEEECEEHDEEDNDIEKEEETKC